MVSPVLVIFGSGPGIGISVAKLFAEKHFDTIALLSRNAERLESEKKQVEEAAKQVGRDVKVFAIPTDLSDRDGLRKSLKEVEKLGPLGLVLHNAARINPAPALTTSVEEVDEDFRTANLALYIIAQWAVPLLQSGGASSPSFFVTNSLFPEQPHPYFVSLSMSKASQQNLLTSLNQVYGEVIHFGVVKVMGQVAPENAHLNPQNIAKETVAFYEQQKGSWELTVSIYE